MGIRQFFRAIHKDDFKTCQVLYPQPTSHEATDERGNLIFKVYDDMPIFKLSEEPILSFSKTKGGAVLGAVTGERGFRSGMFHLCKTEESPDVNLSHHTIGDFEFLQEVRFERPVRTDFVGTCAISQKTRNRILGLYDNGLFEEALKLVNKECGWS